MSEVQLEDVETLSTWARCFPKAVRLRITAVTPAMARLNKIWDSRIKRQLPHQIHALQVSRCATHALRVTWTCSRIQAF